MSPITKLCLIEPKILLIKVTGVAWSPPEAAPESNLRGLDLGYEKPFFVLQIIEEGVLEAKTECYAKDKVKKLLFF